MGQSGKQKQKTMKKVLLTAVATLSLATATIAQNVPNYVPTNGLVGWWPFNGNANDESGNNNNGTVNGATLTSDRFGDANKTYETTTGYISVQGTTIPTNGPMSISFWFNCNSDFGIGEIICLGNPSSTTWGCVGGNNIFGLNYGRGCGSSGTSPIIIPLNYGTWHHVVYVSSGLNTNSNIYYDGIFVGNSTNANSNNNCSNAVLYFGVDIFSVIENYPGKLDDIGIWNRALTQQEISDLYNAVNCNNNLAITPQNNVLQIGNTATFNATTADANPNYIWQSDFGQGFQTLNNYGNYSGVNTNAFAVANVQLANHNQAIRAISTSGNCIDTSNVAYITIADTCITNVTVYDTVTTYISVTDTLFINVNTIGLNNNTIINTIKVFPNPANSHLNLDFGNFNTLNGYSIKIYNSLSQVIYNQAITQQSETIDLNTFGGNGIYFLHLINAQNNTVEIRKIVLQ